MVVVWAFAVNASWLNESDNSLIAHAYRSTMCNCGINVDYRVSKTFACFALQPSAGSESVPLPQSLLFRILASIILRCSTIVGRYIGSARLECFLRLQVQSSCALPVLTMLMISSAQTAYSMDMLCLGCFRRALKPFVQVCTLFNCKYPMVHCLTISSTFTVLVEKRLSHIPVLFLTCSQAMFGALFAIILSILVDLNSPPVDSSYIDDLSDEEWSRSFGSLMLSVVASSLGWVLFFHLNRTIGGCHFYFFLYFQANDDHFNLCCNYIVGCLGAVKQLSCVYPQMVVSVFEGVMFFDDWHDSTALERFITIFGQNCTRACEYIMIHILMISCCCGDR
jgi:hypothetical protein